MNKLHTAALCTLLGVSSCDGLHESDKKNNDCVLVYVHIEQEIDGERTLVNDNVEEVFWPIARKELADSPEDAENWHIVEKRGAKQEDGKKWIIFNACRTEQHH